MITKLRKQIEQNLKISEPKSKTIPTINKRWNKIDEKFKKIEKEEFSHDFKEKLKVKKKGLRQILEERRKRREKKYKKKNYDEEEEEKEKARKLAADSKNYFKEWLQNQEQYPFDHNNFGKKQKRDIKGMVKKILLYGGLPTLLVVSLGVLSNKKINTGKVKKNIKVKANVQEKIFKKAFVSKLKEYYKTKRKEIKKMDKEEQKNLADTQKRKENRNKKSTNPFDELIKSSKLQIKKPPESKKSSNPFDKLVVSDSNPQQGIKSPPKNEKPATIQEMLAQNFQNKKIPKKPVKKTKPVNKKNQRKKKPRVKFTIGLMEERVI
jgi:hypothetical protein